MMAASPTLKRLTAFLAIFLVFSGAVGSRIIGHGLVGKDGFQIYGGAGKALLFGLVCLAILIQRKGLGAEPKSWSALNLLWLPTLLTMGAAWYSISRLTTGAAGLGWMVVAHLGLIGGVALAAGAIFGPSNLLALAERCRREIIISVILAAAFYGYVTAVYGLWKVLAVAVLRSVSVLLRVSGINVTLTPQHTLLLGEFGVDVAKYCSGIESIALFTALYLLVAVLDWNRLDHKKLLLFYFPALIVLFGVNIARVYALILAAYYINTEVSLSLFHTYAGMVFFIIYSALFWRVSYGWLLVKHDR